MCHRKTVTNVVVNNVLNSATIPTSSMYLVVVKKGGDLDAEVIPLT